MKTLLEIVRLAENYLNERGIVRPRREAEELIADVLSLRRIDLYLQFERPLEEQELQKCREALKRRGAKEPCQYIAGKVFFAGVELAVNRAVLIPRQETELLVEKISEKFRKISLEGKVLLDMCTGSGGIGLALKKRFPELEVYLSDISSEALEVASQNAKTNQCDVFFLKGDLFEPFQGKQCDFFICNPPYVTEDEFEALEPEVKWYEPKIALVGGKTGLEFYSRISEKLACHLRLGGQAWMEIGSGQGEGVKKIFNNSNWSHIAIESDWSGRERFFSLERDSFFR